MIAGDATSEADVALALSGVNPHLMVTDPPYGVDYEKKAREVLGIDEDSIDLSQIDSKYKELAKKYHPDMPGGDANKFKQINHAHKILRRELQ